MQQLHTAIKALARSGDCAQRVLSTVPALMCFLRGQMRRNRQGLSVPQFRALVIVNFLSEATLSDLAEHLGLSLPAASRLVGSLVNRGLVIRRPRLDNRRCLSLSLTARGRGAFRALHERTRRVLAGRLASLSHEQRRQVSGVMDMLTRLFLR